MILFKSLCSMPNGRFITLPFAVGMVGFVLSFRIFASCDLVQTEWSIDCSTALTPNCIHIATVGMGMVAKETFVADMNNGGATAEMVTVCKWYSAEERQWLLGGLWEYSTYIFAACIIISFFTVGFIGFTSSCHVKTRYMRGASFIFGLLSILNILPILVYQSDFCKEDIVCNPSHSTCVSACRLGNGSWQLIAVSFMWVSAMITTWFITPSLQGAESSFKDEENQKSVETITTKKKGSKPNEAKMAISNVGASSTDGETDSDADEKKSLEDSIARFREETHQHSKKAKRPSKIRLETKCDETFQEDYNNDLRDHSDGPQEHNVVIL